MVNSYDWKLTDRVVGIPIEGPYMKGVSLFGSWAPDPGYSACSLDKLWHDIYHSELFCVYLGTCSYSVELFIISLIRILFSDHNVEFQNSSEQSTGTLTNLVGDEFWHFCFID